MHATLADVLTDIVQNAIESDADTIDVTVREENDRITVDVVDNGRGMDAATLERVADPFFTDGEKHPERSVGLGVAFLLQLVEAVGGTQKIISTPGAGTEVSFSLPGSHVDLPPVGDLVGSMCAALTFVGEYDVRIRRERNGHSYDVHRRDLRDALGELESVGSRALLYEYIQSQEESLHEEGGHDGQNDP